MPPVDHLLVVATNFAESHGGVEAHLAELGPRLVDRGFHVTLAYLGHRRGHARVEGMDIIPLPRRVDVRGVVALPDPRAWTRFTSEARKGLLPQGRVTCVATHTRFFPMSALGVRLARRIGVPVVHTEHGAGSVVTGSPLVEVASRLVDRTMGRWVLRSADRVVAVSEESARFTRELAGVDAIVLPNGIDVGRWISSGLPDTLPVPRPLVFVGRVVAEKGWRDFLDVAAGVRPGSGADIPVHVVGDGPELAQAREYAAKRSLPVTWHGRLAPADIAPLLRGAVYVNPSVAAEGFQLTQLEALVAGAAVVTYEVGVASELARSGVGDVDVVPRGDVVRLTEAARRAITRPPAPPTREQVERWDWDNVARQYAEVLRSVGSGRPR